MSFQPDEKSPFITAFDAFVQSYTELSTEDNKGLTTYFESDWLSPCFEKNKNGSDGSIAKTIQDGDEIAWLPYLRSEESSLSNLEEALGIGIPQDLQQLFCRYFSHDLNAKAEHGALTILQAWNEDDFDRLQKNLIAHVLMKRRLKQADTLFFAVTDEDDFILSILLSTGAVMLEKVGKEPHREIAPDLATFMRGLVPAPEFVAL